MLQSLLPVLLIAPTCLGLPGAPKYARGYEGDKFVLPDNLASQFYDPYDEPSGKREAPSDPDSVYSCAGPDMADYPKKEEWLSFEDMWKINEPVIKKANDGADYGDHIRKAIEEVSKESKIDSRLILGVVMQESQGNLTVHCTGVEAENACGIMQVSQGSDFKEDDAANSVLQMIKDGVYGTNKPGLYHFFVGEKVEWIKNWLKDDGKNPEEYFGNPWSAVHIYNAGKISSKDMNTTEYEYNPNTRVYANDIASRLIGWNGQAPGCRASAGEADEKTVPDIQKCKDMKLRPDTKKCW